jgi:hypothetical protein
MKYFALTQNFTAEMAHYCRLSIPSKLPEGVWWDVWAFTKCSPAKAPPYPFFVRKQGIELEVNFVPPWEIPVMSRRVAELVQKIAPSDVERIPVEITDVSGEWQILNVLTCIDCIDHSASHIDYYPAEMMPWEDQTKAGKPRGVRRLVINGDSVGNHHVFRPRDWTVTLVVSEQIRAALTDASIEGIRFIEVSQ